MIALQYLNESCELDGAAKYFSYQATYHLLRNIKRKVRHNVNNNKHICTIQLSQPTSKPMYPLSTPTAPPPPVYLRLPPRDVTRSRSGRSAGRPAPILLPAGQSHMMRQLQRRHLGQAGVTAGHGKQPDPRWGKTRERKSG